MLIVSQLYGPETPEHPWSAAIVLPVWSQSGDPSSAQMSGAPVVAD